MEFNAIEHGGISQNPMESCGMRGIVSNVPQLRVPVWFVSY